MPKARVLVLAPANLSVQLVSMLEDRLGHAAPITLITGQSFLVLEADATSGDWGPGVYFVSLELLSKRDDISGRLVASVGVVTVDEAHRLAGRRALVVKEPRRGRTSPVPVSSGRIAPQRQ